MSKNILVISSSFRSGGNSDQLADAFIKGAKESHHHITKIYLKDQNIHFCRGCLVCQNKKPCVIHDDANEMSGQMKTLLDRTNPLFVDDYQIRDIYLLTTAADEDESAMDGVILGLKGWIKCFDKMTLKGVVKGLGIDQYGDIEKDTHILKQAYIMGKNIV